MSRGVEIFPRAFRSSWSREFTALINRKMLVLIVTSVIRALYVAIPLTINNKTFYPQNFASVTSKQFWYFD